METDITFCVQLSPEGHPAAIECIYGLSYEWSLECGAMRYIFGLFIGCWIEHSAYVPEKDSDHLRRLTAEDIIKSGFERG